MAAAHLIERLTCRLYGMNCRVLRKNSEKGAVAHLIERFACRFYSLKLQDLYLSKDSGKMEGKIQSKCQ